VKTIQAGVEAMKTGTTMGDAVRVMDRTAGAYGLGLMTPMGHFVGLDLVEGRFDADSEVVLDPGIAFILHPRLDDPKGSRIILWGETYLITDQGAMRLNKTDDTLHTV
jgi:Xaa-Pro aminopeptidase